MRMHTPTISIPVVAPLRCVRQQTGCRRQVAGAARRTRRENGMLGIADPQIWLAYVLCILSTILCVYYGAKNWDKGDEPVYPEDVTWAEDEKKATAEN